MGGAGCASLGFTLLGRGLTCCAGNRNIVDVHEEIVQRRCHAEAVDEKSQTKITLRCKPCSKTKTDSRTDWLMISIVKIKKKNILPWMKAYIATPDQVVSESNAMIGWQSTLGRQSHKCS